MIPLKLAKYSREDIGFVCYQMKETGGDWDTGCWVNNNLIIFMNIGIPGRTGHDFPNDFNPETMKLLGLESQIAMQINQHSKSCFLGS